MATLDELQSQINLKYDKTGGVISGPVTITRDLYVGGDISPGGVTYGGVLSDYAEYFERGEWTEEGDLIMLDVNSDKEQYIKAIKDKGPVIGVHNNHFAEIVGGKAVPPEVENIPSYQIGDFIPVMLKGRAMVKVIGDVHPGDYIVPTEIPGVGRGCKLKPAYSHYAGIALTAHEGNEIGKVRMMAR